MAKALVERRQAALATTRQKLTVQPGLAIIWVGDDPATAAFIRVKERWAKELNCQFFLHHFPQAEMRQLDALIKGLNRRPDIHGVVLQLPLPANVNRQKLINVIDPAKDVDNLRGDSGYAAPTAAGIVDLLTENHVNPTELSTVIIGGGLLVGAPLAELWRQNGWAFDQINSHAAAHASAIRKHDLLIACTGVHYLVTPAMVHQKMTVVDGSGVDVETKQIEPLVKMITPAKGAIGPLTVVFLFANLLTAAERHQSAAKK